jgi:hypothetical protein
MVEKDKSAAQGEVSLLATLVSQLAEQFNDNRNETANEIAEFCSLIEANLSSSQVIPPCTIPQSAAAPQMSQPQHTPPDRALSGCATSWPGGETGG